MGGDVATGGGFYREPALYDVVNTPGTAAEVDALERIARRFGPPPPWRWLEPACGTGRYLRVLRGRGHDVTGHDPLPEMVDYARRRLSRWADRWRLDRCGFTDPLPAGPPHDVAFCPVNSLRHLPDDQSLHTHLAQMRGQLVPGGIYVVGLDLHHAEVVPDEDVWEGRRGRLRVCQVIQYLPPVAGSRVEEVIVEMMVGRPRGTAHHSWRYSLRTYTEAQWCEALRDAGWRRLATCDARGHPVGPDLRLAYQLEVLQPD